MYSLLSCSGESFEFICLTANPCDLVSCAFWSSGVHTPGFQFLQKSGQAASSAPIEIQATRIVQPVWLEYRALSSGVLICRTRLQFSMHFVGGLCSVPGRSAGLHHFLESRL